MALYNYYGLYICFWKITTVDVVSFKMIPTTPNLVESFQSWSVQFVRQDGNEAAPALSQLALTQHCHHVWIDTWPSSLSWIVPKDLSQFVCFSQFIRWQDPFKKEKYSSVFLTMSSSPSHRTGVYHPIIYIYNVTFLKKLFILLERYAKDYNKNFSMIQWDSESSVCLIAFCTNEKLNLNTFRFFLL